jgi:uncharacterized protein (DUF1697 family)
MESWVALLRGVNVGGAHALAMADLRKAATGLGWRDVRSYIASGNLVFRADGTAAALAAALQAALRAATGLEVAVVVLPAADLRAALAECPFPDAEGCHLHVFFLWSEGCLVPERLQALRAPGEALEMTRRRLWLHTPNGIGRSKLGAGLGRVVTGTEMTGRNLNTLRKLVEMLDEGGRG